MERLTIDLLGASPTTRARDEIRFGAKGALAVRVAGPKRGSFCDYSGDEIGTGLGLAEGIETAISVMQGFGWRPVWCATSAGGLARFPALPNVQTLTIFADQDPAGINAARACAKRWGEAKCVARILAPPVGDFKAAA